MSIKDMSDLCARTPSKDLGRTLQNRARTFKPRTCTPVAQSRDLPEIRDLSTALVQKTELPPLIIKDVLHKGATMVFGGGSKTNKTFCLMDLAFSVSQGIPWWNFDTTEGNVLYVDFELQQAFFDKRLRTIVNAKGLDVGAMRNFHVWNMRGHASDIADFTSLLMENIKGRDYSLIILDPIYKALGKRDENKAGDINSLFNEIDKVSVETGAAVVVGHHFPKGNHAGKESIDRFSGSGVFGRSPDSILMITKHEQKDAYTVEGTLRNSPPLEPFCVRFEYPLMKRDAELDPRDLKRAGAAVNKYSQDQLLEALGDTALSRKDWLAKVQEKTKMSERSFDTLKKKFPASEIVKDAAGRFVRVRTDQKPADAAAEPSSTSETANSQNTAIATTAVS